MIQKTKISSKINNKEFILILKMRREIKLKLIMDR